MQHLEQIQRDQPEAYMSRGPSGLPAQIVESVMDCYVHTKVCSRCQAVDKMRCKRGYELLEAQDEAFDNAFRVGIEYADLTNRDQPPTQERVQADHNVAFAQLEFVRHMKSCQECKLKNPRGRYSLTVWNIEVARSQRL